MQFYFKVVKFVEDSYAKGDPYFAEDVSHLKDTAELVKKLKPDADEALLISAVSHDIERAFRDEKQMELAKFGTEEYYKIHQEKGADIVVNFLKSLGADKKLTDKVWSLISKHEVGGDEDQTLLKDADSLSFFTKDGTINFFLTKRLQKVGKENIKKKFDWMFNRIISEKAKEIARPLYESALKRLE